MNPIERPSEIYHENSKLHASDYMTFAIINEVNDSPEIGHIVTAPVSNYPGAPVFELPKERVERADRLESVIVHRRSCRRFSGATLRLSDLSKLLYLADGIVGRLRTDQGVEWPLRSAPSGGGLGPIDLYCLALRVDGIPCGGYYYNAFDHRLEQLFVGDPVPTLRNATGLGESVEQASLCIVLSASMARTRFKYGERSYRFALLEAGHIAQNILLVAEANTIGAVSVGGFIDDILAELLRLDGCDQIPIYAVLLGHPK